MTTTQIEKIILFEDKGAQQAIRARIEEERKNLEIAIAEFNKLDLGELKSDEIQYYLATPAEILHIRWDSLQQIPKGFPKNINRDKYIEMLVKPDFQPAIAAAKATTPLRSDLYALANDGTVTVNESIAESLIHQSTISIDPESSEYAVYEKLLKLIDLLKELDLLKVDFQGKFFGIDLNAIGLGVNPYAEEVERYSFTSPVKLKAFLTTKSQTI